MKQGVFWKDPEGSNGENQFEVFDDLEHAQQAYNAYAAEHQADPSKYQGLFIHQL